MTKQKILENVVTALADESAQSLSLRQLGERIGISPSVIYHYYSNKEELLFAAFLHATGMLGSKLEQLPNVSDVSQLLRQRIGYQFDNAKPIVAVLKYFMSHRSGFRPNESGWVPPQAYRHIAQVLERGAAEGIYQIDDLTADAKTITHAINGFILEYYPDVPKHEEREVLIDRIHNFLERALLPR